QTDPVFQLLPQPTALVSRRRRLKRFNPAFAAALGGDQEDLRHADLGDLVCQEDREGLVRAFDAALQGTAGEHEARIQRPDGERRPYRWQMAPGPAGEYVVVTGTETTGTHSTPPAPTDAAAPDSEQLMALIYGSAVVGIALTDVAGRFIRTNAAFERITGYASADLAGQHFDLLFREEQRPLAHDRHNRVIRGEPILNNHVDLDLFRRDGVRIVGNWGHARVVGPAGEILVVTTLTDVTERRRAERALRDAKERFEIVAEASSDAIWDWNIPGGECWWNSGLERIIGSPGDRERSRPESWLSRIHPDDRERVEQSLAGVLAGTENDWEQEYRLVHADGSIARVLDRGRVMRDEHGTAVRMAGAVIDLTRQREAQDALRRSEERFARAFFSSPIALSLTTLEDGRYVDVNDAFLDMYGFLREEVIGKTSRELNVWGDAGDRDRILRELRANRGSLREFEAPYRTHAGEIRTSVTSWEIIEIEGQQHLLCIAADVTARHRAEQALREAEQYRRSVVSAAPVMLLALDLDGRFTLVEGTGLQALDLEPGTLVGKSAWEQFESTPALTAAIRRTLAGEQLALEVMLGKVAAEMRLSPLRNENGDVTGAILVGTDVTARREAEQARQLAEDRFNAIVANMPVIVWATDARGLCTFSRGGALQDGVLMPGLAVGRDLFELYADNPAVVANLRRALAGEAFSATVESLGRWYETVHTPIREGGKVVGLIAVSLDITHRREDDLNHRLMAERLRSIASNAPVILLAFDRNGRFQLADGAALGHFQINPEALIGRTAAEIFGKDSPQIGDMKRALAGEEFSIVREFAGRTWDTHLSNVRDESGEVVYLIAVATDITERRRTEEALLQAQKLESLGVLAGGVAHDFNNLLVGIMGNAGLALLDLPEGSPAREAIHAIQTAGQRAADLARQMLAYSGKGRFVIEPVDLNALVHEMGQLLRVSIPKNATLRYALDAGLPPVDADATQLRQVVMNLVVNAADAIGERDGIITIATTLVEADRALLAESFLSPELEPGTYVSLEVRDTGVGMDGATRARIFDPFFSTKFTGRGLGLAAALGIVRGHKGAIRVNSQPAEGSVFTLLLPASAASAPATTAEEAKPQDWSAKGTILVVDDERTVRTVLGRALQRLGLEVLEAEDGAAAVELFAANAARISCVLLDMTMPRMNGDEAFAEMQRLHPGTPVILMSGYNEQDTLAHFPDSRPAGFVQKPFEITALCATVREVIGLDRPASA
ncbi:MAG: PAS domain S-box protein, partial [Dehalococcoidia bacterium]|nr:PAS domain S-box protein [Dehalococcoidia bacterium]